LLKGKIKGSSQSAFSKQAVIAKTGLVTKPVPKRGRPRVQGEHLYEKKKEVGERPPRLGCRKKGKSGREVARICVIEGRMESQNNGPSTYEELRWEREESSIGKKKTSIGTNDHCHS